jgi:hypothetical protein
MSGTGPTAPKIAACLRAELSHERDMDQEDKAARQRRSLGRFAVIVGAAALGFGIWAASPALTGHAEPWDAQHPYYSLASLIGGGFLGFLSRAVVRCYVGAWLGQVIALAVLPGLDRGWILLGVMTTAVGSLLILLGAAGGYALRRGVSRRTGA